MKHTIWPPVMLSTWWLGARVRLEAAGGHRKRTKVLLIGIARTLFDKCGQSFFDFRFSLVGETDVKRFLFGLCSNDIYC